MVSLQVKFLIFSFDWSDACVKKPQMHAHMPPELLVSINVPRAVLKSLYLLPSLMHRLESLMLASQLRKEIHGHDSGLQISSLLVYLLDGFYLLFHYFLLTIWM